MSENEDRPDRDKVLCGQPVGGDVTRPCALRAGHKGKQHRDQAYVDKNKERIRRVRQDPGYRAREVAYEQEYRETHPEWEEKNRTATRERMRRRRAGGREPGGEAQT